MEKIKCIVLDDDLAFCERIAAHVKKHLRLELAAKFTNPEKANKFLLENPVPLIFIDMEMPGITGIEFLNGLSYKPYAIIITGHPDFAVKAFELAALDYILKPFSEERFYAAVNRAIESIEVKSKAAATDALGKIISEVDDYFFVRSDQNYIKLRYKDVVYIEAMEDFVQIYLKDKDKPIITLVNLKQLENTLSASIFIRAHKSFIVNMNHVTSLSGEFLMLGNKTLPIGPSFKDIVSEKIMSNKVIKR
jgi:two-component system LytT family response regulator